MAGQSRSAAELLAVRAPGLLHNQHQHPAAARGTACVTLRAAVRLACQHVADVIDREPLVVRDSDRGTVTLSSVFPRPWRRLL